ncbi:cell cycle checkpoint protein RAD17 isoform X2 [Henckelia pumila]|uniref:cell cycle checkpoint protein RAD17 isoform X2 n=1 Tax=Henckelia pumila TaxID=405737 RepID=UPI003C6DCC38
MLPPLDLALSKYNINFGVGVSMGKGKRKPTIVISSSDDDEDHKNALLKANFRASASTPTRKNSKKVKRVSLSSSCPRSFQNQEFNGFDEVKRFCQEFDQGFAQFKVSSGSGRSKDLWVDKYKPTSLKELAVHKKKVEEVKAWFEERLKNSRNSLHSNVLLISGQAGVGKSATIYAVAAHLGADVCEWNTPAPTLWQEHLYISNSGIRYMSKLDEFDSFVEKIRKYGLVSSPLDRVSQRLSILLIDDLPVVNGKVTYGKLHRCLHLLLQSVRTPTVILINDYGKSDSAEHHTRYWEELQSSLQNAGAYKVTFNPITVNSIRKTLTKICRVEQLEASDEQIDLIAKASGGDIRHAITSLQYFALQPHLVHSLCITKRLSSYPEEKENGDTPLDNCFSLPFGKDANLSLFHALGKFLHNKREAANLVASGRSVFVDGDVFLLKEKYVRCPLKMDAPEFVLSQAHGQARVVSDFLQENVLDFVDDEAIEDAAVVSGYLSDTDLLLTQVGRTLSQNFEAENVVQSAAASVAVRGVLFGNTHPVSSRWHVIRRPKLWQVEQSQWQNKCRMANLRDAHNSVYINNLKLSVFATEFKYALTWLGCRAQEDNEGCHLLNEVNMGGNECFDGSTLGYQYNENEDDEIEDW